MPYRFYFIGPADGQDKGVKNLLTYDDSTSLFRFGCKAHHNFFQTLFFCRRLPPRTWPAVGGTDRRTGSPTFSKGFAASNVQDNGETQYTVTPRPASTQNWALERLRVVRVNRASRSVVRNAFFFYSWADIFALLACSVLARLCSAR